MQFLPTTFTSSNVSALGGVSVPASSGAFAASVSGEANAFLDSLNQELAAAGVTPVVDLSETNAAPKGFRTVARDVSAKITEEDANTILASLKKKGVQDSALTGLEALLASGQPLTLGSIAGSLVRPGRKSAELSEAETQELTGVLQKMQFSQKEADELIAAMQNGNGFQAFRAINSRLASLGGEGSFAVNTSELRALARGLDVSESTTQKLAALMRGQESVEVTGTGFQALLAPAAEELGAVRAEREKLAKELKDAIDTALNDKKIRSSIAPVADTRGSQKTERAETRMRDDLTLKGNKLFSPESEKTADALADEENAASGQDAREKSAREESAGRLRHAVEAKRPGTSGDTSAQSASKTEDGFDALAARLDAAAGMTVPARASSAVQQQTSSAAYANRQEIFAQVEQGMLRQLADGSKQMTLRLDPAELGQLTVLLTVKGGEVRALIRTENAETTALLSEQMTQLRANLEEQGLKVAQLDVETQLPQDAGREGFSGMEQFNQEREMREQARFMRLARLRRESGESLAQDVQSTRAAEEISPSGLHIIA